MSKLNPWYKQLTNLGCFLPKSVKLPRFKLSLIVNQRLTLKFDLFTAYIRYQHIFSLIGWYSFL